MLSLSACPKVITIRGFHCTFFVTNFAYSIMAEHKLAINNVTLPWLNLTNLTYLT